jgi:hypothetical protein
MSGKPPGPDTRREMEFRHNDQPPGPAGANAGRQAETPHTDEPAAPVKRTSSGIIGAIHSIVLPLVHVIILIAAVVTLYYAIAHEQVATELYELSLKGVQYQNAFTLLDQSLEFTDAILKEPGVRDILENKSFDPRATEAVNAALEKYQLILFKGSVLEQRHLTPEVFWKAFVSDFCEMYKRYPFIQAWWAGQKTRQPYSSLSSRYRDLNYECQGKAGEAYINGASEWNG